jgi:hypothetical protein
MLDLDPSFWPASQRTRLPRLALAILGGAATVGFAMTALALLIATVASGWDAGAAFGAALDAGELIFGTLLVLMPTGATFGVLLLWALRVRGASSWAVTGALTGALTAVASGTLGSGAVEPGLVVTFAILGLEVLLAIRWLGGIRSA